VSESTAVAEAPESVIPTTETPPPAVEETPSIPAPEAEAAAPAEPVEITADNLDELPEWKALAKPPEQKPDAAAKDDLPGEANEDIQARLDMVRVQRQAARLQATDANWRELLTKEVGLTPEEATTAWQRVLGPALRDMHADHDLYYQEVWKRAVLQSLPEDAAKTYMSRQYRGPAEVAKTMFELGKKAAQSEWEGKAAKGEYVTRQQAQAIRDAAFNRGRGLREAAGEVDGASSGTGVRGGFASSGARYQTKTQARNLHVAGKISNAQMRAINANPNIPEL
jgi:hypothetical protein